MSSPRGLGPHNLEKIAIFIPSFGGGGAERAMILFAEELLDRGIGVDIVVVRASGPFRTQVPRDARIVDLDKPGVLSALPSLTAYLRREQPGALYSTMSHSNIVALIAGRLSRVPVVVREANVPLSSKQHSLSNRIIRGLVPLVYPWARAIISVSKDVADELCRMSEKLRPKITVLPTPVVSPGMLTMAEPDPGHPWLAPNQPPVILGVGRLHPQKDFATLLRAFAEVRARRPLRLLILGEGAERPALELLAAERGLQDDVALPGFVENPFPYMKRAAVLVLSSRYEGMPNALLQAMALGTPVISTDCPGGSRDALQDGRFGALVPVGDVAALAAAIEAALSGPRRSDAAEYVHSRFGVRQAADRYLEVLHAA